MQGGCSGWGLHVRNLRIHRDDEPGPYNCEPDLLARSQVHPPGGLGDFQTGTWSIGQTDAQIDSDGAVFFFQFVQQENLTVYHWEQQVTRILPRPCPLLAPS